MRIYWISDNQSGNLGIMPRPRGNEWLENEILELKNRQTGLLISLLENDEQVELELTREGQICAGCSIEFIRYPVPDRGVPADRKTFRELAQKAASTLEAGKTVVIHCRMGIGRSSMLAAYILRMQGIPQTGIFERISADRGLKVPDTEAQEKWVRDM